MQRSPRQLLDSIPGWQDRAATFVELAGGFNNHSYRVEAGGKQYLLRISDVPDKTGSCDRKLEASIQQLAAAQGLAANVLYVDPASGLLLSEYVPGTSLTTGDLRSRKTLQRIAAMLRQLHRLPKCGVRFDAAGAAARYLEPLRRNGESMAFAEDCEQVIKVAPSPDVWRCCHNDVVAENIIDGGALKLIDFEYACDNDPLFDLASTIGWHNMRARDANYLLDAYVGHSSKVQRERLRLTRRQFDALQWLWLAARQVSRPATVHAEQMQRVAARLGN